MNEKKVASRQNSPTLNKHSNLFVTDEQNGKRLSSNSFLMASVVLAVLIAALISFTPQFSGAFLLGGVMAILMVIVVIQHPELGAYFLILSVFTNISEHFAAQGLPSVNQPLIALTYLSILIHYVIRQGDIAQLPRLSRVEWSLLAYCLAIVLSMFVSKESTNAFHLIIIVSKGILSGFCIYLAFNSKKKWKTGAWILIIVVANLSLLGVLKMASGTNFTFWGMAQLSVLGQRVGDTQALRYSGPIGESNIWAQVLAAVLPLVIYRFTQEKNAFIKINLVFAALFITLAIFYTGSRGAMVSLALVLPMIALERKMRLPSMLFISTGLLVLLMLLPSAYTERFKTLSILFDTKTEYSLTQDEAFAGRQNAMLAGLEMFRANPFLGVGFGNYGISYWEYVTKFNPEASVGTIDPQDLPKAHSLYVEVISETGLFGILTFLAFFSTLLTGLLRIRKQNNRDNIDPDWTSWMTAFFFSMLSFLISGIFLHGILWRYIWMLIGFAMAALAISENRSESFDKLI